MSRIFWALLLCLLGSAFSYAQSKSTDRVILNADSMKRLTDTNTVVLKGNVQVIFQGQSIYCDEALIKQNEKVIEAYGNVYFTSPTAVVTGDRIVINYENNTGEIYNGVIKMDQVLLEGEVIKKLGENEYEAYYADYTACTTCPPGWSFSGTRINATVGGYAYLRNPLMKVTRIPIFWLPYLVIPLNTKRQTGFLFPTFEYASNSGFSIAESFFWAMSESTDSTWTVKNYEFRGTKGFLNYRYVLDEQSRGEMDAAFLRDRLFAKDPSLTSTRTETTPFQRWHYRYKHLYEMPHDITHRMDINLASDTRYTRDFQKEMPGYGDPALENRLSLSKNTGATHVSLDSSIYVNQLRSEAVSDNTDSVHRFPEIKLITTQKKILESPFFFDLETRYSNFSRDGFTYDDLNNNQLYDPNIDQIRTGQRLDLIPRMSAPIAIGPYIDLLPALSFRESQYQFALGDKPSTSRRLLKTDFSARTRFSRIFADYETDQETRYRHEIMPEVLHTSIPWLDRQNHPFWGTSDTEAFFASNTSLTDSDKLQFDYHDRLNEKNLFTFAITQRLIRKRWEGNSPNYQQIALLRLAQSYDYYESIRATNDARQPFSDISALLDVRLDNFETNSLTRYYPYQNVATTASRAKLIHDRGHYIQADYSLDFAIKKGVAVNTDARSEDLIGSMGVVIPYATLIGRASYSFVTKRYKTYGYTITLNPPGNCWLITFSQDRYQNELVSTFNASFLFDGKTSTDVSGNQLMQKDGFLR